MEVAVILVLLIGGVLVVGKTQEKAQRQLAGTRATARLRHLRSGQFPSSCSWCKNTALARKLFVFERTAEQSWRAADVLQRLESCDDAEVETLAGVLATDQPRWRRICTERCAKEFFAAEHVPMEERFASCAYCSARVPAALSRCPNCGAVRTDA